MGSVRRLSATLTLIVSTRLELLANELQSERLRLTRMVLYASFALFCCGMGLLLLTIFIVVLFWDTHRLAVLGSLSLLFFAATGVALSLLRKLTQEKSTLFAASLAELAKDRQQLHGHHE